MASNRLPTNGGLFIGLVTKMIKGINDLGLSVPVTMVTAAEMQTELGLFTEKNDSYNEARSARQAASDIYQAAVASTYTWLLAARLALVPKFGSRWSTAWAQAGFINNSTAVPAKAADQLALIAALRTFFTKNPSYQSPGTEVTAAKAGTLIAAATTAQNNLRDKAMELKDAGDAWTLAYDPLRDSAVQLIKNLEGKLDDLDPRWLGFGLQMPGTITTPGKPTGLVVHMDENGSVIPQCDAEALATRYRWRGFIVGVETTYRLLASTTEPMASIPGVMPGQTLQLIVQAVNENLQGVASDPVLFTVPPLVQAKPSAAGPKATAAMEEPVLVHANGNGHAVAHSSNRRS